MSEIKKARDKFRNTVLYCENMEQRERERERRIWLGKKLMMNDANHKEVFCFRCQELNLSVKV